MIDNLQKHGMMVERFVEGGKSRYENQHCFAYDATGTRDRPRTGGG
jgi:hypothetical protein